MIIILCLEDSNGMMFNRRRLSRDREITKDLSVYVGEKPVFMNEYSAALFPPEAGLQLQVSEDFLEQARPGDFCFVENVPLLPWEEQIEKIIIYKWNRDYPADLYFDIPLEEHGWKLSESKEFAGYSHEKITREIYVK